MIQHVHTKYDIWPCQVHKKLETPQKLLYRLLLIFFFSSSVTGHIAFKYRTFESTSTDKSFASFILNRSKSLLIYSDHQRSLSFVGDIRLTGHVYIL